MGRFFGSLSPRPLDRRDAAWVEEILGPGELALWERMSKPDRKHAAGVARAVDRMLGGADRPVLAAALLHDVGKIASGFGTFRRVCATIFAAVVGRERATRGERTGAYLRHDEIGAVLLEEAGSDPLTIAWAREHHLPVAKRTVPVQVAEALEAADDD